MKNLFKGCNTILGLLMGFVLGVITGNILIFLFLGLLFGIMTDMHYEKEEWVDHPKPW